MNSPFDSIGLEVRGERAINVLAEQAGTQGEASRLARRGAVLHGRCWKLGEGLEVWTVLYESETGEVFYADCRPGFRARFPQRISPWALTEYDEEGEAIIHGYLHDTEAEVLFELQNLTEVGIAGFHASELYVGLCGLAYEARICAAKNAPIAWQPTDRGAFVADKPRAVIHENDWSLCGRVIATKQLRNPLSGSELLWVHLDLHQLKLEVLINRGAIEGKARSKRYESIAVGQMLAVDVWLQGHVLDRRALLATYEGVDESYTLAGAWRHLKRRN